MLGMQIERPRTSRFIKNESQIILQSQLETRGHDMIIHVKKGKKPYRCMARGSRSQVFGHLKRMKVVLVDTSRGKKS